MKKYLRACRNMIPLSVRLLKPAEFFLVNLVGYVLIAAMGFDKNEDVVPWTIIIFIMMCMVGAMDSFLDYFCFAGISSRKSNHSMAMIRVAHNAESFIKNSLIGELFFRAFWEILCFVPIGVFVLIFSDENTFAIKLFSMLSVIFFEMTAVNVLMIITRHIGLTLQIHLTVSLALAGFWNIIPEGLFVISYRSEAVPLPAVLLGVSVVSAVVSAVILLMDSCKGFICGYYDEKEE